MPPSDHLQLAATSDAVQQRASPALGLTLQQPSGILITVAKKRAAADLSAQLRAAIKASELSMLAICRATGIDRGAMSRFVNGKAGFRLESADRVVSALGLRLVAKRKRTRRREETST